MRFKHRHHNSKRLLPFLLATTAALLLASTQVHAQTDGWFNITIIHTNDIHSRVDPANALGVPRHIILLLLLGNVTSEIMNELGYDATTVGNHEWDDGPDTVKRFWRKPKMPVVCCNIDYSKNPEVGELVKPYTIIEIYGIGVIGYITPSRIMATDPDMEVAAKTRGLDLIVGGHSHTYLGNDPKDPLYGGPYPTKIKNLDGEETFIVQAYCWGRFIGNLDISFNPEGKIVLYAGNPVLVENSIPGDPGLLAKVDTWRGEFEAWSKKNILGIAADDFNLDGCSTRDCYSPTCLNVNCRDRTKAFLYASFYFNSGHACKVAEATEGVSPTSYPWPDFSFANTGAIRAGVPKGDIAVENIVTTSPFGNYIVQIPLTGKEILDMLEGVVVGKNTETGKEVTSFIQVSGLRFTYDSTKPANDSSHIIKAEIQDRRKRWRRITTTQTYSVVTMDFVMTGGDGILVKKPRPEAIILERMDEILMAYVEKDQCISPYVDGRIKDVGPGMDRVESVMMAMNLMSYLKNSEGWPPGTPGYLGRQFPKGPEQMHRAYAHLRR
ncbi:MAG: Metallo-dependent phosphatase-like protein [Linnemannia gamsii]|nr:MAG: Metallo-dependent phosphatase-like protein [Linnemannia gamsii]